MGSNPTSPKFYMSQYNHEEKKEMKALLDDIIDFAKEVKSNALDIDSLSDRSETISIMTDIMTRCNDIKKSLDELP